MAIQVTNFAAHISTNATTLVKTGAGRLVSVIINKKGATANIATIYDGIDAGGTVLAVLDTTSNVGPIPYGIDVAVGITVVTATGTAGDLTVVYA